MNIPSTPTVIASLNVTAGSYVVTAKAALGVADASAGGCTIIATGVGVIDRASISLAANTAVSHVLTGAATLTVDGSFQLVCESQSGVLFVSDEASIHLIAIRVDQLTAQSMPLNGPLEGSAWH